MGTYEFRSIFMPYCLIRLDDGRYIVVNRNYKPLGITSGDYVIYETHPSAAKLKITAATAKKLSWAGSDALARIYLYNDGCIPTDGKANMDAYLSKLSVLAKLKVTAG
jgi:hypothetical protein